MTDHGQNEALTITIDGAGALIAAGEIDLASGPLLEAAVADLDPAGTQSGASPLVIDLAAVSFIDSSGLRSLLTLTRRAAERSSTLVLRSPTPEVMRLLEITGTKSQFEIESA